MSAPNDDFQPTGEGLERGTTADTIQNDYTSRTGQKQASIPVQSDNDAIEDPIDANTADSDAQLGMMAPPSILYETDCSQHGMMLMPSTKATSLEVEPVELQRAIMQSQETTRGFLVLEIRAGVLSVVDRGELESA